MAITALEENGESIDWFDEEDLDTTGLELPSSIGLIPNRQMPVVSTDKYLSSPLEERQ